MDPVIGAMVRSWQKQRDYAARLVADLSDADMVSQPVPGVVMNHPAWTFGHLSPYASVLALILRGQPFEDPASSPYGRGSKPLADASAYPPKAKLMDGFLRGHDELDGVLGRVDPAVFGKPVSLKRWEERFPLIGDLVVHLTLHHESAHLGQVSAWRRAGGRPSV